MKKEGDFVSVMIDTELPSLHEEKNSNDNT